MLASWYEFLALIYAVSSAPAGYDEKTDIY
jgi:hypothetical protein